MIKLSKNLLLVVFAILLVIVSLLFYITREQPENNSETESKDIFFEITTVDSDVFVKGNKNDNFTKVSTTSKADSGSVLKTSISGGALVVSPPNDSLTVVGPDTEMTFALSDQSGSMLKLQSGKLWSRVEKSLEQGEFYEIETDEVLASVRGTSFGTERFGTTTLLSLTEGEIILFPKDSDGKILDNEKVILKALQKATLIVGEKVRIENINPKSAEGEWLIKNNPSFKAFEPENKTTPNQAIPTTNSTTSTPTQNPASPSPNNQGTITLKLIHINPAEVTLGDSKNILVYGEGLSQVNKLLVGFQEVEFFVLNTTSLYFKNSEILKDGVFDITAVSQGGTSSTLNNAITVNERAPEPDQGTTPETMRGSNSAPIQDPNGGNDPTVN